MPQENKNNKELKLYQYWFKTWWGLLILAIAFPWLWWLEVLYFIYLIYKRKEYQLTRKNLIIGGSLLAAIPVFIMTLAIFFIASDVNNAKVRMYIEEGEFQKAREQLKQDPNPELTKELNKLGEDYINNELEKVARNSKDNKFSEYIVNKTHSEYQTINEQVKSKLIAQLDTIDDINTKQEKQAIINRQALIDRIKDNIKLIENGNILVPTIPSIINGTPESDEELKSLKEEMIAVAREYQRKKYPIDRKNYANFLNELLGSEQYTIYVSGKNNSRLVVDHPNFYSTSNINLLFHDKYESTLKRARYSIVEYTSKEFGESTEYQLNSPHDTFIEGVPYN